MRTGRNGPRRAAAVRAATPTGAPFGLAAVAVVLAVAAVGAVAALGSEGAGAQEGGARGPVPANAASPGLEARSWALVDAGTGLRLAGKDPDARVAAGSTTNVMVALLALEGNVALDEEVTVSEQAERFVGGVYSNVGLISGESLSVRELLTASLVPSGTDAVYALAEHLGGGGGGAGVEATVERMNERAKELGLENTRFENPAGLDARGHYSSAGDLAVVAGEAMRHRVFREIVAKRRAAVTTQNRSIRVLTTNQLLYSYRDATGVKTGASVEEGPSLVASAENADESYVAVVLGAGEDPHRFDAARTALEFGFARFDRGPLVDRGKVYERLALPYRRGKAVELAASEDVPGVSGPGLEVERRVTAAGEPPPSVRAGQRLGTVEVLVDGESVGSSPLVAAEGYGEATAWQKARTAVLWPARRAWPAIRDRLPPGSAEPA